MTGPEHHSEAERLLVRAQGADHETALEFAQLAQAHATLALAAAAAKSSARSTIGTFDADQEWAKTIAPSPGLRGQ